MLTLIDRHLIGSYLKAYVICLISLMGLFVVVDLFTNMDKFTQNVRGFSPLMKHIGLVYANKLPQIFNLLCEAIVLLAGMFTVAWVQRNNELLPLLSAGASTRRVVRPVLISACLVMGLAVLNQEFVLPIVDSYLVENPSDPEGRSKQQVSGGFDANGMLITGKTAVRQDLLVQDFNVSIPPRPGREKYITLSAKEGRYIPPGEGQRTGGWMLIGATPDLDPGVASEYLERITEGRYFLRTEVDFDAVTRSKNWMIFQPIWVLMRDMDKTASKTLLANMAVVIHVRLTRPFLGMILVLLGLSVILRDHNRSVFISAGLCLVLCGLFFFSCF